MNPVLKITDGNTVVDLLVMKGWLLKDWKPAIPEPKGGGIFRSSPLVDGRKLAFRKMDNIIDTFNLVGNGKDQDALIGSIHRLQKLLEKAISYWTSDWQLGPVWIEARGSCETEIRYATIVDYRLTDFGNPYKQPFFSNRNNVASEATLLIEHTFWQETIPGEIGHCVELDNETDYPSVINYYSGTYYPTASAMDGTYSSGASAVDLTSHNLGIGYCNVLPGNCQAGIVFNNVTVPAGAHIKSAKLTVTGGIIAVGTAVLVVDGQSQRGGAINSVTIVNGGNGYHNPSLAVRSSLLGSGTGAVLSAKVVGGVITEVSILDAGYGYVTPVVTVTDSGAGIPGHGANITATASTVGVDAGSFSGTNSDFIGRSRTDAFVYVNLADGQYPDPIDVTSIIDEIVSNSYWASGDKLGMFISLGSSAVNPGTGGREIHSFNEGWDYPELYIEWGTEVVPIGRDTTCAQEVYVANKHNTAPINYIYRYDANFLGSPLWSVNLFEYDYTTTPLNLLPVIPSAGDCIYFGSCPISSGDTNYGPFFSLVLDISTGSVNVAGVFEYYNTSDVWHEFDITGGITNELCGDDLLLQTAGVQSLVWTIRPANWKKVEVTDGIDDKTGYWIRFRVTSVGVTPTPPYQWHRDPYTVLLPYIDIDASQVPGDIPALARIKFGAAACNAYAPRAPNMIVMGLRSLSRGSSFDAYLNASDVQNTPGVYFTMESIAGNSIGQHLQDSSITPTGRLLDLTGFIPIGSGRTDFTPVCNWTFHNILAKEYIGTYHAYARCLFSAGAIGTVKFRLSATFGDEFNVSYSDINTVPTDELCAVDLGQINIVPSYTTHPNDAFKSVRINLESFADLDSRYTNACVYDVILIPADEWSGNFGMPKISGTAVLEYGYGVDVDAITVPRQYRAVEYQDVPQLQIKTRTIVADWAKITSGEPIFQANEDQRLWFFQYFHGSGPSYIENCGAICAERSARYLLMRGSE